MDNSIRVYLDKVVRFDSFLSLKSNHLSQTKSNSAVLRKVEFIYPTQDPTLVLRQLVSELKNKYK